MFGANTRVDVVVQGPACYARGDEVQCVIQPQQRG
jgi:hypothetical protein